MARRNLSPSQRAEVREKMIAVAKALRAEDPKKNTLKRVATLLGVSFQSVSQWLTTNSIDGNTCIPDARVVIPKDRHPAIVDRIEKGESQSQVAADEKVSQQQISNIVAKEKAKRTNEELKKRKPDPLKGSYDVIVIDPPWPIEKIRRERQYATGSQPMAEPPILVPLMLAWWP